VQPVKGKKTLGEKVNDILPYVGAVAGGLEAAGSPQHAAPAAQRLLAAEEFAANKEIEEKKLGIAQQQANTEAGYKEALAKQYGVEPVTIQGPDGQPMTVYAQPKDFGRLGAAAINQAGGVEKQKVANTGKESVERIRQGAGVLVEPEYAKLAGQPQLAGQY